MPTPITSLELDPSIEERVQRLAAARQLTPHGMLREAVEQYLQREETREQLRHEAQAVWESYQTTGSHVTEEEADGWLAKLEAGEDAPPPPCHV